MAIPSIKIYLKKVKKTTTSNLIHKEIKIGDKIIIHIKQHIFLKAHIVHY